MMTTIPAEAVAPATHPKALPAVATNRAMESKMDTGGPLAIIGSAFLGAFVQWAFKRIQAIRRPRPLTTKEMHILLDRMDKYDRTATDVMVEMGALRGFVEGELINQRKSIVNLREHVNRKLRAAGAGD